MKLNPMTDQEYFAERDRLFARIDEIQRQIVEMNAQEAEPEESFGRRLVLFLKEGFQVVALIMGIALVSVGVVCTFIGGREVLRVFNSRLPAKEKASRSITVTPGKPTEFIIEIPIPIPVPTPETNKLKSRLLEI